MPRSRPKARDPVQEQTPDQATASQPNLPTAHDEPDVFDQAIAARQQAQLKQQPGDDSPQGEASPTADESQRRQWQSTLPDPFGRHGIQLGAGRSMRLFRNQQFQQNAIVFYAPKGENPKPSDDAIAFLKEHSWRWRPETDAKPWTKQFLTPEDKAYIDKLAAERGEEAAKLERSRRRAAGDRQAEEEFVILANEIRQRNGLEPVEYNFGKDVTR
jgi:hypothetical protein